MRDVPTNRSDFEPEFTLDRGLIAGRLNELGLDGGVTDWEDLSDYDLLQVLAGYGETLGLEIDTFYRIIGVSEHEEGNEETK